MYLILHISCLILDIKTYHILHISGPSEKYSQKHTLLCFRHVCTSPLHPYAAWQASLCSALLAHVYRVPRHQWRWGHHPRASQHGDALGATVTGWGVAAPYAADAGDAFLACCRCYRATCRAGAIGGCQVQGLVASSRNDCCDFLI